MSIIRHSDRDLEADDSIVKTKYTLPCSRNGQERLAYGVLVPAEIGGLPVLIEVTKNAGTEPTSAHTKSAERIEDMFTRAQAVIEQVAVSAAEIRGRVASRTEEPDQLEIQFGVKFSAQGQIVIASANAEASLSVKVVYNGTAADQSRENGVQ
jgi:hypothetical protein